MSLSRYVTMCNRISISIIDDNIDVEFAAPPNNSPIDLQRIERIDFHIIDLFYYTMNA